MPRSHRAAACDRIARALSQPSVEITPARKLFDVFSVFCVGDGSPERQRVPDVGPIVFVLECVLPPTLQVNLLGAGRLPLEVLLQDERRQGRACGSCGVAGLES